MYASTPTLLAVLALLQTPAASPLEQTGRFKDRRVRESSGIVASRQNPGVLWTHNDSGDGPYLYATDLTGRALGRLRVTGAVAIDWEDIASGPCPDRFTEACLYIADTGDNLFLRPRVTVYAIRDPTPPLRASERALVLRIRYPDGPRDVEALFVDADATIHLVTKGNRGSIDHYAVDRDAWDQQTVVVARHVQTVGVRATKRRRITGAALAPSGHLVALRSVRFLYLFDFADGRFGDAPRVVCADDLPAEGEAVDFLSESVLVMTSEARKSKPAPLYRFQCDASSSG